MARLDPENTHWSRVYDFNDPEKSGKNWEIMDPEDEAEAWLIPLNEILPNADSLGPCENPVRRDAKFINMEDGSPGGVTAFSFDTTQVRYECHEYTNDVHRNERWTMDEWRWGKDEGGWMNESMHLC